MADISTELQAIQEAVYGEEVRGAIVDALTAMNTNAEAAEAWATGGSGGTATGTNNAKYYAEQAAQSAASLEVDDTLSISGAAADAKTVGDEAFLDRGTLTSSDDCDNLDIGVYTKLPNVTVAHGVNSNRATVISFASEDKVAGKTLFWIDEGNSRLYYRTFGSNSWSDWTNFDSKYALRAGANLTGEDDCNSLGIGTYYKDGNVSVGHGVNSRMAVIVVLSPEYRAFGQAQLWFDCTNAKLYFRIEGMQGSWSAWDSVKGTYTMRVELSEGSVPNTSSNRGMWASGIGNFGKSTATLSRIKVNGASDLAIQWNAVNLENGAYTDTLTLSTYGSDGAWIESFSFSSAGSADGAMVSEAALSPSAAYATISIYNGASSAGVPAKNVTVTGYGTAYMEIVKNPAFTPNVSGTRWYRFGYKVGDAPGDGGATTAIYNTGMMLLPPNYAAEGAPVPVIINVHGSDAYTTINGSQIAEYEPYYNFLADCGYALIDCYGWTNRYQDASGMSNPWPMPTTCRAYQALVKIMLENFNLDGKNVFVLCKSLGGHLAQWISGKLQIRAACWLAPALATYFGYSNSKYRAAMIEDYGLEGVADSSLGWATKQACLEDFRDNYVSSWGNAKRTAFYLANEEKLMGWLPEFLKLAGATAEEKLTYAAQMDREQTGLQRIGYPPVKIWAALDDSAISPTMCATSAQQLRNGGGEGVFRVMPSGTGGHHSVDTDASAPQAENITTPLGISYSSVPLAYYEAWQWMESHRI